MSNNSSSNSFDGDLFFGEPYLLWLQYKIVPYMIGISAVLTVLVGVPSNIAYLKIFVSSLTGNIRRLLVILAASDFIAYVIVVVPAAYISFGQVDSLSDFLCTLFGVCVQACFGFQFSIILFGLITALISRMKGRVMEFSRCITIIVTLVILLLVIALALVPVLVQEGYSFHQSEYKNCYGDRSTLAGLIHSTFVLFIYIPPIIAVVCFVLLIHGVFKKKRQVEHRDSDSDIGSMEIEDETATHQENTTSQNVQGFLPCSSTYISTTGTNISSNLKSQFLRSYDSRMFDDDTISEHSDEFNDSNKHVNETLDNQTRRHSALSNALSNENIRETTIADIHEMKANTDSRCDTGVVSASKSPSTATKTSETSGVDTSMPDVQETANTSLDDFKTKEPMFHSEPSDEGLNRDIGDDSVFNSPLDNGKRRSDSTDVTSERKAVDKKASIVTWKSDITDEPNSASVDLARYIELMKRKNSNPDGSTPPFPQKLRIPRPSTATALSSSRSKRSSKVKTDKLPLLSDILYKTMDDNKSAVQHQMAQYLVVWFCLTVCWIPHVLLVYIDMSGTDWWESWFSVAVMCTHWGFCIKPMIMLGVKTKKTTR